MTTATPVRRADRRVTAVILAKMRERFLLESPEVPVADEVFEDLEAVLGPYADLTAADIAELTPRLHTVFRRVMCVARQTNSGVSPGTVEASRGLLEERVPHEFTLALGYLRRLAVTVAGLLDELLEEMP
ncbi:DUF6415 family natural product biosynthesis protein [Streptomyces sp. NPDC058001]|uniref:DUF6415 family natural product biosynthesis protein n=1 Tax=Streptomyces sp. NPDC058001 TaxID=3346300 RepID=UPI0036E7DBE1